MTSSSEKPILFSPGDRVVVSADHLDAYSRREVIKNKEAPVGAEGIVQSVELSSVSKRLGGDFYVAKLRLIPTGEEWDVLTTYLRMVQPAEPCLQESAPSIAHESNKAIAYKKYSPNPGIQQTIENLLAIGCPPLPVAPAQDPRKPHCHHQHWITVRFKGVDPKRPEIQGDFCRLALTRVGDERAPVQGDYCRLDEHLQPIARFTGKNPSYLDRQGRAQSLNHHEYQKRFPTDEELSKWFCNTNTGVGTLGGHSGVDWLDYDVKNYSSQEDCDRDCAALLERIGDTWTERTGSNGWRIAVKPEQKPSFTNFSTSPDGEKHIGEAIWEGRFTVLAPTIHPNGKPYRRIGWSEPAKVKSLQAVGIYPTKDELANQSRKEKRERTKALHGGDRPTDPAQNPWDIRNFAEYLDGCRIEGSYYECRCPAHDGVSDNSLSIHLDTGGFWCWSGCDTQRIYQEAKRLAVAGGYKLPERQESGPVAERDRANERRRFRFRQGWENGLQNDFILTEGKGRKLKNYEGYAPMFDPTAARTIAIQGGLGSGKTEAMLNSLHLSIANGDIEGAVWIATRNGLLRDTASRADRKGVKWLHFQDDVSLGRCYLRDGLDGSIVAFAYASLKEYHFTQVDWTNKTVVIDEKSALRKEILNYPSLQPEFERMIKECKHLIIADAFLSNCDLKVIKNLRGGDRLIYKQSQKQDPTPVKWLETRTKDGAISFTHDGVYLNIIRDWGKQGLSFAVAADSATHARVLEAEAKKLGIKTLLCWSKSIESNRSFLNRIDETLQDQQIQGFFYTPTIQNGADVQTRFDRVLVIAQGVLSPLQMLQMSKRVRNAGEIWVSAPRKTADPASVILNPDSNRVKQLTDRVNQAFTEDSLNAPLNLQGWGVWERLTREIERGFNAEYIESLLRLYFANVKTVEVPSTSQKEWQEKVSQLKLQDSERILSADLTKGMDLLRAEKEPGNEADAWAIELAKLHQRYRKLTIKLQLEFHTGDREETLRTCNVLRAARTNKLKYWQIAEQANPDDSEMLAELVRRQPITYAAPVVKVRQYTELYRVLKLNRLACVTQKQELIPDQNCFYKDSPVVSELWQQFQGDRRLQRLFPLVETQVDLWSEICKCFRFLGFEGRSHQARIKTTEAYPNGKYQDGRRRYSYSRTVYFKAWVTMAESGNEVFKKILPELIESINEDLEFARANWRKRQEEGTDPPWAGQAA